jgi:hypothetical protein
VILFRGDQRFLVPLAWIFHQDRCEKSVSDVDTAIRAEKHSQALTESLFSRLPVSMLRMFFKRTAVDAVLNDFTAGRW